MDIDLVELLEKVDINLNVPVYAGDVVSVPEKVDCFFYLWGDVNKDGAFDIKKGKQITATKALAFASGLMPTAKAEKTVVMRPNADGSTKQIPVDVKKLLKGKSEDIILPRMTWSLFRVRRQKLSAAAS